MTGMDWTDILPGSAKPYPHQQRSAEAFLAGKSVLLRAPTGSGKTEAIVGPFLHALGQGTAAAPRLIYSLPMRVLATSLRDRAQNWATDVPIKCQHGDEPQAALFHRPVVFATVDQSIESFITCPPTLPRKLGNIAAGSIASAVLAFDEVQLLDPLRALQSMMVLLEYQKCLDIPFFIATATLPDALADLLVKRFDCQAPIDVDEHDIPSRANRTVGVRLLDEEPGLPLADIARTAEATDGNIAIICNTVRRAQEAYQQISRAIGDRQVLLLHSRFLSDRRAEIEEAVIAACGKPQGCSYRRSGVVLVATQVVEAGLDISFDHIYSEAAPIDSLIQRAGRIARGGGQGTLHVFTPAHDRPHLPYKKQLVDASRSALVGVQVLDWPTEQRLVNQVLGSYLNEGDALTDLPKHAIEQVMQEAAHQGSRRLATQAVRSIDACRLSIHSQPDALSDEQLRGLEYVSLPTGTLRAALKDGALSGLHELRFEWDDTGDRGGMKRKLLQVIGAEEIRRDAHYICSPTEARHDPALGLLLEGTGCDFACEARAQRPRLPDNKRRETWTQHAIQTAEAMRSHFIEPEQRSWQMVADWWDMPYEQLVARLLTAAALHDLGKLNVHWQAAIGNKGGEPLAHSTEDSPGRRPAHATVSGYMLWAFHGRSEPKLHRTLRLAIQHHHSVGATDTPSEGYRMVADWREHVARAMEMLQLPPVEGLADTVAELNHSARCEPCMPDFRVPRHFVTYSLFSRALRISDWIATSGGDQDAPIHYENWFRNG